MHQNASKCMQNASKCMQNELCKCFVHEIIKEMVLLYLNRLKLKNYLLLFVMEDPVQASYLWEQVYIP